LVIKYTKKVFTSTARSLAVCAARDDKHVSRANTGNSPHLPRKLSIACRQLIAKAPVVL